MSFSGNNPTRSNQSTEKAFAILELLAAKHAPMRLMDIAGELKLNTSTVARFLTSLQVCGYVAQEPVSQRYYPTFKICRVANQVSAATPIQTVTHPYLTALSETFGEATCVSVEQDMQMVYIDVATAPSQMLLSVQQVGNTTPMHCTGNGKLLLSAFPPEKLTRLIESCGLPRYTENTITTRAALEAELRKIREQGYALDNEEREIGVRCLAYPIRDYTGEVVAGISVTGPSTRVNNESIERFHQPLKEAAAQISVALGYEPQAI